MEKLLLNPAEVAEHLGVGKPKVYELMRTGQLRSIKLGGSRRVPRSALLEMIDELLAAPR